MVNTIWKQYFEFSKFTVEENTRGNCKLYMLLTA